MSNCIFMSIKPYSLKAGFISGWRSCGRKVSCVDMFNRFPVPDVSSHSDNSLRNGTCCWNATSLSRISCTPCRCVTGCPFFGSTDGSCGYGSWYCIKYLLFTLQYKHLWKFLQEFRGYLIIREFLSHQTNIGQTNYRILIKLLKNFVRILWSSD